MMRKELTAAQADYNPQFYKSFEGALEAFFSEECPQLGGARTRRLLVDVIRDMVTEFFPSTSCLSAGQTPWTCVHKDARSSYAKTINQTRLTPVVLDLVKTSEIADRAAGVSLEDIRKEAVARLFKQAYAQDGVLTSAEVAVMLKIGTSTVGNYIAQWEEENQQILPRRGTIHDMGPTLTHKREIIEKLVFEGKSVETVCRETVHSPEAVLRYITSFKQILLCRRKGLQKADIAFATKMSLRLIDEYYDLMDDYKTKHPHLETEGEMWINDLVKNLEQISSLEKDKPKT